MDAVHIGLVAAHVIGTALGVGGATFAEVFYLKATKDGKVDPVEQAFLGTTYRILRIGTLILIFSGVALTFWWYFVLGSDWVLTSGKIWAKWTLLFVILFNAVLIRKRKIPMWLGAGISFGTWYYILVVSVWERIPLTYAEILVWWVIFVLVVSGVLEIVRKWYVKLI